jgi:lysozyme family protein
MADFNQAAAKTLKLEGGYQDNPSDHGNLNSRGELVGTNHGITAKTYENLFGKVPSKQDMLNLTTGQAVAIYKSNYWNPIKGDQLINQSIANNLFDCAINQGIPGVNYIVQRALQKFTNIAIDGKFGPLTLSAINQYSGQSLFSAISAEREAAYIKLKDTATGKVWFTVWIDRIKNFVYNPKDVAGSTTNIALAFFLLTALLKL